MAKKMFDNLCLVHCGRAVHRQPRPDQFRQFRHLQEIKQVARESGRRLKKLLASKN